MSHTLIITKNRREEPKALASHKSGSHWDTSVGAGRRSYVWSAVLAFILVCTLVTAPIFRVFASVDAVSTEEMAAEIVDEVVEVPTAGETEGVLDVQQVSEDETDVAVPEDEGGVDVSVDTATSESGDFQGTTTTTDVDTPVDSEVDSGASTAPLPEGANTDASGEDVGSVEVLGTTTATTTNASSTPPTTTDTTAGGGVEDTSNIPPVPEVPESIPPTSDEVATTTTEEVGDEATSTPQGEVVNAVTNDENRFSFGTNECVAVGGGAFYCTESDAPAPAAESSVLSVVDEGGDKEIYLRMGGTQIAITDNQVDDDAPFYDQVSKRVVWHGMTEDRFQVFSYSLDDGDVRQLTNTSYNNMQATAYGDITLWQAWIGNDWEIMMDDNGKLAQLTDNDVHDVMPRIRGDYVLWQSFEGDAWRVKVLDRSTGIVDTILGDAGASAENPRFVLVYDSKKENGDVETRGYDFNSKKVIPLTSTPAPVPEKMPEPEESGEERALVQQQTSRTEVRTEEGGAGGDGDGDGDDTASSTPDVSTGGTPDEVVASSTPVQTGFDLIIPELPNETETDAQDEVASTSTIGDNKNQ